MEKDTDQDTADYTPPSDPSDAETSSRAATSPSQLNTPPSRNPKPAAASIQLRPRLYLPPPKTPSPTIRTLPFRTPLGLVRTKHGYGRNRVFALRVHLDFPSQECTYVVSPPRRPAGSREITVVLSHRGAIHALAVKRFERGFDCERGTVRDCGVRSGRWVCEFPRVGGEARVRVLVEEVRVEEGDYGVY